MTARVAKELGCGSDHVPVWVMVPGRRVEEVQVRVPEERMEEFAQAVGRVPYRPRPILIPQALDQEVANLRELLTLAARATGRKVKGRRTAPWYITECVSASIKFRRGNLSKRNLQTVWRKAKREYWVRLVDDAVNDRKAYKLAA